MKEKIKRVIPEREKALSRDQQVALRKLRLAVVGKKVSIVGDHPHSGEKGAVESVDCTPAGWGLCIDLGNDSGCYVYTMNHLEILRR